MKIITILDTSNFNYFQISRIMKGMKVIMDEQEKFIRKSIGNRIKLARTNTKYTQEQLAEKLSLSSKYISQLERGLSFGSATTIVNLCNALNINSDFLFDDLINVDENEHLSSINIDFLKSYIQLNDYNKDILKLLADQLIHLQNSSDRKQQKRKI